MENSKQLDSPTAEFFAENQSELTIKKNRLTFWEKFKRAVSFRRMIIGFKITNKYGTKSTDYRKVPKNASHSEIMMVDIFKIMLYNKQSDIIFNSKTKVACVSCGDGTSANHIFISEDDIRFVNKDVINILPISHALYNHVMYLFSNKQNVDFIKFQNEANSKMDRSMEAVLEHVKTM